VNPLPPDLFRDLADNLSTIIIVVNEEGEIADANETAAKLIRHPRNSLAGRPLAQAIPRDAVEILMRMGREALASGREIIESRRAMVLPGRGFRFFSLRALPLRRTGRNPWIAFLMDDVTDETRREMVEDRPKTTFVDENRVRRAFLARMSHEIRTPMNGIIGMTDLALQSNPPEEIVEYLNIIKSASDSLLRIINDVLDYAKAESGRLEIETIPFQPVQLVDETLALLRPAAEEKGLALEGRVDPALPEQLEGDPTRIRQILFNLVGNALKFTEEGNITVTLAVEPEEGNKERGHTLVGTVADTGIGIDPDTIDRLFQPFSQADAAVNREYGGTGLGLAICRTLTRLMGGDIEAANREGGGTVFTFRIEINEPPVAVSRTTESEGAKGFPTAGQTNETEITVSGSPTALVAEDNRINRHLATRLLERIGFRVLVANDGAEALDRWRRETPDIVLMDIQMPIADGFETTRRIREEEDETGRPPTPIIALTAHVLEEERREALEAGMDGWVGKPITPRLLFGELERLLPGMVSPKE
jgi:PAS domain S-box-containing protein